MKSKMQTIFETIWPLISNLIVLVGSGGFAIALTNHFRIELSQLPILLQICYVFALLIVWINIIRIDWSLLK